MKTELEKKIKYHLDLILGIKKDWSKLAEGLAEIAEKYYKKKADHIFKIYKMVIKDKIIEVLESPLGKNYKAENNLTLLEKLREQIALEILGENEK